MKIWAQLEFKGFNMTQIWQLMAIVWTAPFTDLVFFFNVEGFGVYI